ncbi:putative poly(ADP-ribose) glycohydrolase, BRCT domain superfamily [Plasmopara halstedii]
MSREFLLQGVTFAFHCLPPSECHKLALLLQSHHGKLYDAKDNPTFVYVITSYWTDCKPGATLANVPKRLVTRFWLLESLRLKRLLRPTSHIYFQPPVRPSTLWLQYPREMYDDKKLDDSNPKVLLPSSPQFLFRGEVAVWPYVASILAQPIANIPDFIAKLRLMTILNSRQPFNSLEYALKQLLTLEEKNKWFHDVLPMMQQLVLQMPQMFAIPPPLLTPYHKVASHNATVASYPATQMHRFTKLQVLTLVCACFFGIFPNQKIGTVGKFTQVSQRNDIHDVQNVQFPSFSAIQMFSASTSRMMVLKGHKIRCFLQYFFRMVPHAKPDETVLTTEIIDFVRVAVHVPKCIPTSYTPSKILEMLYPTTKEMAMYPPLSTPMCVSDKLIEDLNEHMQIDFANEFPGGGVLDSGCVQEEIRFLISPELLVSCLVFSKLESYETFVVHGTERFCTYKGYGGTFQYTGNYQDKTDRTILSNNSFRRNNIVVGMDATDYSMTQVERQYSRAHVWRDLVKAFAGFSYKTDETCSWPVGTGNWGCGVFKGDRELKFLIQWLAASLHDRNLVYVVLTHEMEIQSKVKLLLNVVTSNHAKEWDRQEGGLTLWLTSFLFQEIETKGQTESVLTRALLSLERALKIYQEMGKSKGEMEKILVKDVSCQEKESSDIVIKRPKRSYILYICLLCS